MKSRFTIDDFIEKASSVHNNKYDYSLVEYKNTRTKVKITCPVHGVFKQVVSSHLRGRGCRKCSSQSKTTEQFIIDAYCKHGDKYNYKLIEYKNNKTKVKIICPVHGVFEQEANSHLRGSGCPECNINKQRLSIDDFIEKASSVHNNKYDYSLVEYKNWSSFIKIICPVHGVFEQRRNNHLRGDGCPECAINRKVSIDDFIEKASSVHNNKYDYSLVEYKTTKDKSKIICPVHGVFEQQIDNHKRGKGCPLCVSIISKAEQELQEWLKQYIHIETNNRSLIKPYELDIVIPSKKIAIEYNGLYWHSEQRGKDKNYHLNKFNLCKEQGYRLIQIWENEWLSKKDIVKSIILNAIGKCKRKVHGRKCEIKIVQPNEARYFYNNNHIQEFKGGEHHGLYHKSELVSLMTIDKRGELHRFANRINTIVHGAFSKLIKSYGKRELYTFADLTYFTGNVYEKNGFVKSSKIPPRYKYIKGLFIFHRRSFQRKYLKDKLDIYNPSLTEYQNMLLNGYDRIWDCGKIKFITC